MLTNLRTLKESPALTRRPCPSCAPPKAHGVPTLSPSHSLLVRPHELPRPRPPTTTLRHPASPTPSLLSAIPSPECPTIPLATTTDMSAPPSNSHKHPHALPPPTIARIPLDTTLRLPTTPPPHIPQPTTHNVQPRVATVPRRNHPCLPPLPCGPNNPRIRHLACTTRTHRSTHRLSHPPPARRWSSC